MNELRTIIEAMEPGEALTALSDEIKKVLAHLDEDARVSFVTDLLDGPGQDKVASMVNL